MGKLLLYLLYGVVSGFSAFTPLPFSAHQVLFPMLFKLDSTQPLLCLFVHAGILGAVVLLYRQKMSHLYEQTRLPARQSRGRRRILDAEAMLDVRLLTTAAVPALLGALISAFTVRTETSLPLMALLLVACATAIYLPEFLPGGDRKAKYMTPAEALLLGVCMGLGAIPGICGLGLFLSVGSMRKCDRRYLLDIGILLMSLMLPAMILTDVIALVISGFSGLSLAMLLLCLSAAAGGFGGGIGAMMTMRFLADKIGFSGFAFYNWGLGLFCFLIYLML